MGEVIAIYLNQSAFRNRFHGATYPRIKFIYFILAFGALACAQYLFLRDRALHALSVATAVSLLGSLSWFVVFKSHSYMHPFLNGLSWYLPFMPLLFVGLPYGAQLLLQRVARRDSA